VLSRQRNLALAVVTVATTCGLVGATRAPASAQVSVTLNGRSVDFEPAPIERAGRVFVPLRGVFESLGASVVYENGTINATRGPVTVSLQIGSTTATVSGAQQTLDVAPFIVGASTYVPLRFVSQALGANVQYDAANRIVAIATRQHGPAMQMPVQPAAPVPPPPPAAPPPSAITLQAVRPERGASVGTTRPTISADFSLRVDPNSVHVSLDGLDVTAAATRSPSGFVFEPPSPLQSTTHVVRVSGRDRDGGRFERTWSFTSGTTAPLNFLDLERPLADAAVDAGSFVVRGKTAPNSRVRVLAGSVVDVAGPFAFGSGNFAGDTTADVDGRFEQTVTLTTVAGARIGLTVTSTDPQTKEGVEKRLRLRAR
jgi:hypothetical protein